MIVINNLSFSYNEKPVLQNINISFEENLTHGIVGLNGSGKTTFFNILSGFLTAGLMQAGFGGQAQLQFSSFVVFGFVHKVNTFGQKHRFVNGTATLGDLH